MVASYTCGGLCILLLLDNLDCKVKKCLCNVSPYSCFNSIAFGSYDVILASMASRFKSIQNKDYTITRENVQKRC
jgi:hypothetical protein